MRTSGVIALVLLASGVARAQSAKVYTADDGIEVVVVSMPDGKALVRVTGSGSELDGKVRAHEVENNGRGVDYRGRMRGRDYYTVRMRDNQYTVNLPKRDSVRLKYHEDKTKAVKVAELVSTHQQQTKDGTLPNMERFDRKARLAEQDKALKDEVASLNKKCGTQITMSVDWESINDEALLKYSISSFCGNPLGEAARLCESAEGKAFVADKIKKAACTFKASGSDMSLQVDGGTLKWTTSGEAYNQEEHARKELLGAPAPEGQPVWGKLESLQQRLAMEKTALCSDGKSHYVVLSPKQLYWGDGKSFVEVPNPGDMVGHEYFFDPRHVRASSNANFRGYDMRIHSRVDADLAKKTCAVACGDRTTQMQLVDAAQTKKMLIDAKFGPSPQKHRPHRLLRDELGNYYYVDKGFRPGEEKRFRLFKGPKGSLKEQKMTNVVSDSEGEIFSTKTGSLRLIIDKKDPGVWLEGKKSLKLREVPIGENMPMIYNELGVYAGVKMGNPCDDL